MIFEQSRSEFFVSGPVVKYRTEIVHCCRDWEVITQSFTWDKRIEDWKKETYFIRKCGICREIPWRLA